jgi:hypothetical protein
VMGKNIKTKKKQSNAEKPISLKPLEFDEAVSNLLKVEPEGKGKSKANVVGKSKQRKRNNSNKRW